MTDPISDEPVSEAEILRRIHALQVRSNNVYAALEELTDVYTAEAAIQVHAAVEQKAQRLVVLLTRGLIALTLYTAVLVYGAIWLHERVRNDCYMPNMSSPTNNTASRVDHWYCHLFPGTDRTPNP